MNERSRELLAIAEAFAAECPAELGADIAVSGSVARGCADEYSDIEMNFWVEVMPERTTLAAWLTELGVGRIWWDPIGDVLWVGFRWRETWFEAGWQLRANVGAILTGLLEAKRHEHEEMMLAEVIQHGVPLRSSGTLERWRSQLADYPDALTAAVIEHNLQGWLFPQWLETRWASADRGHSMKLAAQLHEEVARVLTLLFALNKQYEPDWKWLPELAQHLARQPRDLVARIDHILGPADPFDRVRASYELALDTLELLPASPARDQALSVVEESLTRHAR